MRDAFTHSKPINRKAREEMISVLLAFMRQETSYSAFARQLDSSDVGEDKSLNEVCEDLSWMFDDWPRDKLRARPETWRALQRVICFLKTDYQAAPRPPGEGPNWRGCLRVVLVAVSILILALLLPNAPVYAGSILVLSALWIVRVIQRHREPKPLPDESDSCWPFATVAHAQANVHLLAGVPVPVYDPVLHARSKWNPDIPWWVGVVALAMLFGLAATSFVWTVLHSGR